MVHSYRMGYRVSHAAVSARAFPRLPVPPTDQTSSVTRYDSFVMKSNRPNNRLHWLPAAKTLASITLVGYLCQAAFIGPIRYYLVMSQLEFLWYVPDLLGFNCLAAALAIDIFVNRSFRLVIILAIITAYLVEGYFVSGSVASVSSTFKALVPL